MFSKILNLFIILFFNQYIHLIDNQCPPDSIINPCSCIRTELSRASKNENSETTINEQKSIICQHINNSSFDLQPIFLKLTSFSSLRSVENQNLIHFDSFFLYNTTVKYLPDNVFKSITFKVLMLKDNFQLTTINKNAFSYFKNYVEVFETINTNLSDSNTIFTIIKQFQYLRILSMHNDRLKFIPNYAFNHTYLTHIYFGHEYLNTSQPIETIGDYAFYNLPNLQFLRIFSPYLRKINKYTFAQRNRFLFNNDLSSMLELYLGGEMLDSTSFELTSLNRFRNRFVFIRFYYTSIKYLEENVFQPFLESNPSSLIDINPTNVLFKCHCRSAWIQNDYFRNIDQLDNRVYGYQCWEYDFTKHCTRNK